MSENSNIEWTDHTWSPWEGCTKVSPGCLNCYAEARDKRHLFGPEIHWGKGAPRRLTKDWRKPVKWNRESESKCCGFCEYDEAEGDLIQQCGECSKRPKVFPSVCDWLDAEVPVEWLARFLQLIHDTPHLDWLLLTKRPENFHERILRALAHVEGIDYETADAWEGFAGTDCGRWLNDWSSDDATPPNNVWVGTSVEDQERADKRVPALLQIPARVRFLSVEPLLGPVDLIGTGALGCDCPPTYREDGEIEARCNGGCAFYTNATDKSKVIDWVIIGGESGIGARPCNVDWVRSIVTQCADAGVACFVKQLGRKAEVEAPSGGWMQPLPLKHPKGGDLSEWPEEFRVREVPSDL